MLDGYGRNIDYMRISVTSKCNLRCLYCVAPGSSPLRAVDCFDDRSMTPTEIGELSAVMGRLGIRKVRITGGEPLFRSDLEDIFARISRVPEIVDRGMTTNGIGLAERIGSLKDVGLKRVNISIDSLDARNYAAITGGGDLDDVLKGFKAAIDAELSSVRLNVVLMRGINDHEIDDFIALTREYPVDVRFIELMPIGGFGEEHSQKVLPNPTILASRPYLRPVEGERSQPAVYYAIPGHRGRIGFISPISHKFCSDCNRIRVTCDGKLKLCLSDNTEIDFLSTLRNDSERLEGLLRGVILRKPVGHCFDQGFRSRRNMAAIGG